MSAASSPPAQEPRPADTRTVGDEERLRRFLQWRDATGRTRRPWLSTRAGMAGVGAAVVLIGLGSWVATSLPRRPPAVDVRAPTQAEADLTPATKDTAIPEPTREVPPEPAPPPAAAVSPSDPPVVPSLPPRPTRPRPAAPPPAVVVDSPAALALPPRSRRTEDIPEPPPELPPREGARGQAGEPSSADVDL